ncbi:MAG: tyrosine-type recombinase/integrase [Waterburya sp.]
MSLNKFEWSSQKYDGLFEKEVPSQLLQNPLLQQDIWRTKEDLGLESHEHHKVLIINFSTIKPLWFKVLAKLYVLKRANLKLSAQYIRADIYHLKNFTKFLSDKYINSPKHINNEIFEQYDFWIRYTGVTERTISLHYTSLENFFDTCREEGWLDINTYWFKGRKTPSKPKNDDIDYIPEEVWNQLEENLHHFPEPMQRKVLIIRTFGLRIGELLNLPLDCLRKRGDQWRLRLKETEKFKIEDEIPVPLNLVPLIKEQQKYIRKHLKNSYNYLLGMVRIAKEIQKDINYLQIRINALEEIMAQ